MSLRASRTKFCEQKSSPRAQESKESSCRYCACSRDVSPLAGFNIALVRLLPAHRRDRTGSDQIGSFLLLLLTSPQIGPERTLPAPPHLAADRFLPAPPPHLAADRTGTDPSCSSSPRHRSDRNGPLLLLAENGPLQFLLLSAGSDPL
ncbi:hypothetical protein NQZ68_008586 [Dissostichus eleginoides]|nr:hypothetical protein NQZ68_008586 [Dissostichus eleginoides]